MPLAFAKERKRKTREPDASPFAWGYYFGYLSIWTALPVVALFMPANTEGRSFALISLAVIVVWTFAVVTSGIFILDRSRIAWVIGTLLSLNPVIWIVNAIYGAKRWTKFAGGK